MIDTVELEAVFVSCLFEDGESTENHVPVEGVMGKFGFCPDRLETKREQVKDWLSQLPDSFHADKGGGMSFLNACMTQSGEHWGEHPSVDRLFTLGIALGYVTCLMPRDMWSALPGGMPYYQVNLNKDN